MTNDEQLTEVLHPFIETGALAGVAAMVWLQGQQTRHACVGWQDIDTRTPMTRDTIFRIASLTKPITSAVALMLVEEGRIGLDEPIARWAHEFSVMRVMKSPTGALDDTEPARRPITFRDLLTHQSGLTYGAFHTGPLATAYEHALGGEVDSVVAPDDWIANLAALPLVDQPGSRFHYGHSTDLLGLLIARVEDAPLGEVLRRRLFDPLGMTDTGFTVPRDKRHRQASMYGFDEVGRLQKRLAATGRSTMPERPEDLAFVSGGAGLWSTLDDYVTFARMFVGGGSVDEVRVLSPDSLALMTSNTLTPEQRRTSTLLGMPIFATGHGFGMGVAVVMEPDSADPIRCGGGEGAVGWPGAWGAWWQADPNDRSVMVFLAHNLVELHQFAEGIGLGVFDAILKFRAAATSSNVMAD